MIEVLTIVGGLLLTALGFLAKFLGSLCLIILAMIVFTILFIVLVGMGFVIVTFLLETIREDFNVFDKEINENEERNNNNCNG